jgi:hypothetical protein
MTGLVERPLLGTGTPGAGGDSGKPNSGNTGRAAPSRPHPIPDAEMRHPAFAHAGQRLPPRDPTTLRSRGREQ